jgi:hypothetical protein
MHAIAQVDFNFESWCKGFVLLVPCASGKTVRLHTFAFQRGLLPVSQRSHASLHMYIIAGNRLARPPWWPAGSG